MHQDNSERAILIATVGNTKDPIELAIEKNSPNIVFLAYGRPTPSQTPSPLEIATELRDKLLQKGVEVHTNEISQPENLERCLMDFSEIVKKVNEYSENSKIVVDITGGTKIMSAAALHTFLTSFVGEFQVEYIGGSKRDEHGRVMSDAMIEKVTSSYKSRILEIVRAVENHEFHIAVKLSEKFPDTSEGRFLKNATLSLLLWDNFEYKRAFEIIKGEAYHLAKIYYENNRYGRIPETVIKLVKNAKKIIDNINILTKAQNGEKVSVKSKDFLPLLADMLANAERRFHTSSFAECVLRSYRSLEALFQIKLLELGVNPWKPDNLEEIADLEIFLKENSLTQIPEKLSLNHCFILLKLKNPDLGEIEKSLKFIQQVRNYSFLEHGYLSVSKEKAEKCLVYAKDTVSKILEVEDLENVIEKLRI